jgi:hypothetical protein
MDTNKLQENAKNARSETGQQDEERNDYRLACFQSAREEMNLHFKHRENWVQLQLLTQVVLLALSQGLKIGGVESNDRRPDALMLSTGISLVLASLYYADDSIISHLGKYIRSLAEGEPKFRPWDSSEQVEAYIQGPLFFRYLAQFIAFVLIPTGLFGWRLLTWGTFTAWQTFHRIEFVINLGFLIVSAYLVLQGYQQRKQMYNNGRLAPGHPLRTIPEQRAEDADE